MRSGMRCEEGSMKYAVIGNGASGIAAAEQLRKLDTKGSITMFSKENCKAYSRCLLPEYLSGGLAEHRLFFRDADFYEKNGIETKFGSVITTIDFKARRIVIGNGEESAYDRLLIATGSIPIIPSIRGLNAGDVHVLNSLEDAKRIEKDAEDAHRVCIIGAGFVGLELAFALIKKGKRITLVERAGRVLPLQLDETAARIIREGLETAGIKVILDRTAVEIVKERSLKGNGSYKQEKIEGLLLDNGKLVLCDMIIMAAGSRPNIGLLATRDVKCDRGILVDRFMMTSVEHVYAAGDVVETIDTITGKKTLSPIWPNAIIQGEAAAYNMAGRAKEFPSVVSMQNACEFRDIPMISMGTVDPQEDSEVLLDHRPYEGIYRKLVLQDDTIIGMIFLGDIGNSGVIGALIKNKVNVKNQKHKLLNVNWSYADVADRL